MFNYKTQKIKHKEEFIRNCKTNIFKDSQSSCEF